MHISLLLRLDRTLRGKNAILNIFELWVGLAGFIGGVVFLYQPASLDNGALAHTIGYGLAVVWTIVYMLAGVGIWAGLLRPSPRWEVVSLWLLGGATAANAISLLNTFETRGIATALTLFALTAASWVRAWFVQARVLRLAEEFTHVAG